MLHYRVTGRMITNKYLNIHGSWARIILVLHLFLLYIHVVGLIIFRYCIYSSCLLFIFALLSLPVSSVPTWIKTTFCNVSRQIDNMLSWLILVIKYYICIGVRWVGTWKYGYMWGDVSCLRTFRTKLTPCL